MVDRRRGIESDPNIESVVSWGVPRRHLCCRTCTACTSNRQRVRGARRRLGRHASHWPPSLLGPPSMDPRGRSCGHGTSEAAGVFTTRVQIKPLNIADLSAWLLSQTLPAFNPGSTACFSVRVGPMGSACWSAPSAPIGNCWPKPAKAAQRWFACGSWPPRRRQHRAGRHGPQTRDTHEQNARRRRPLCTHRAHLARRHGRRDGSRIEHREGHVRSICRTLEQLTLISETDAGRYKVRLNCPSNATSAAAASCTELIDGHRQSADFVVWDRLPFAIGVIVVAFIGGASPPSLDALESGSPVAACSSSRSAPSRALWC